MSKLHAKENPFLLLRKWYLEAQQTSLKDPNAAVLSTLSEDGFPRSRIVLAKDFDDKGVTIYTNYQSHKGYSIAQNNKVSLLFYWEPLGKQVRMAGTTEKLPRPLSESYWKQRPKQSQISQYISQQSRPLTSRGHLESKYQSAEIEFEGKPVPCPEHWGGYLIKPIEFEFWCADNRRLHDRMIFQRNDDQQWRGQWLYP